MRQASSERLCVKFAVKPARFSCRAAAGAKRYHADREKLAAMWKEKRISGRNLHRRLLEPARDPVMHDPGAALGHQPRRGRARLREAGPEEPHIYPLTLAQAGPPLRRRGGWVEVGSRLASAEKALSLSATWVR